MNLAKQSVEVMRHLNLVHLGLSLGCAGLRLCLHPALTAAVAHGAQVHVERCHTLILAAVSAHFDDNGDSFRQVLVVGEVQGVLGGDLRLKARLAAGERQLFRPARVAALSNAGQSIVTCVWKIQRHDPEARSSEADRS